MPDRLVPRVPTAVVAGAVHLPGWLEEEAQRWLLDRCRAWADAGGGFRSPRMRNGAAMSVGMVGLGWHWYPYRYSRTVDDGDGRPVGPFPAELGELARRAVADARAVDSSMDSSVDSSVEGSGDTAAGGQGDGSATARPGPFEPDVALVNWYRPGARMGMHVDADERVVRPVVSLSVGDTGIFRWGNAGTRGRPWVDVPLESGDAFVFGGPARADHHGVPRVLSGTAPTWLGAVGGRLNVTVRQTGLG